MAADSQRRCPTAHTVQSRYRPFHPVSRRLAGAQNLWPSSARAMRVPKAAGPSSYGSAPDPQEPEDSKQGEEAGGDTVAKVGESELEKDIVSAQFLSLKGFLNGISPSHVASTTGYIRNLRGHGQTKHLESEPALRLWQSRNNKVRTSQVS